LAALYRALAIGNMGVAAPITAVLSAALPVLFASLTQGVPGAFQITGFGLGLLGVWLLSRPEGSDNHPQGLGLALVAGVGFGGFLILINQAGGTGFLWSLASARATSLVLMSIIALGVSRRGPVQLARGLFVPIILSGVLDVGGNAFFVLAAQVGRLDVAAVLSSLYPATTVLLAWLLLKERMTRAQTAGIVAALLAIPLITTS
jgi:drug/metabolite transporter (DMT)-like permease